MAKDKFSGSLFSTEVELYNALLELSHELTQQHEFILDSTEKAERVMVQLDEIYKRFDSFMQKSEIVKSIDSASSNMSLSLQALISDRTQSIGQELDQSLQRLINVSADTLDSMKKEIQESNDKLKRESALPFHLIAKKNFTLVLLLMIGFMLSTGFLGGYIVSNILIQPTSAKAFNFIETTNEQNKYVIDTERVTVDASKDGKKLILKVQ